MTMFHSWSFLSMTELTIKQPSDFHVHLRQGDELEAYTVQTAKHFENILVMPNTKPPITTAERLTAYHNAIQAILVKHAIDCRIFMAFKLVPGMGERAVLDCIRAGALIGKYYPSGSTTNAEDGPTHPSDIKEELRTLEQAQGILSIHAESPTSPEFLKERDFLSTIEYILERYPKLRIVIEHLSTAGTVDAVLGWPDRVAGTITAHHLRYTVDDLLTDGIDSSLYCKPILKTEHDRKALISAAISGNPKFFFGSDSAPHPFEKKHIFPVPAGAYTAPVRLSLLAEVFEENDALHMLEYFTSTAGTAWYGISSSNSYITLIKKPWKVPDCIDGAFPVAHGRTLQWQIV